MERTNISGKAAAMSPIGTYCALYFEDVGSAVEYCRALVPHIVPQPGCCVADADRPVVWFHVPRRCRNSTRDGCYLFASPGALEAARRAGIEAPVSGYVARPALPGDSVLLFGEDLPEPPPRSRFESRRSAAPRVAPYPRAATAPATADTRR